MNRKTLFVIALVLCNMIGTSQVVDYPAPAGVLPAPEFEVTVDGKNIFAYNTRSAALAYFSFSGTVTVTVRYDAEISRVDIRPASKNIAPVLYRNQISFVLTKPENLSIEFNKNLKRPLFIFANPTETGLPSKSGKNVLFYEAGKIHNPGIVTLKSNQTVYIEGGAVVRGSFIIDSAENVKITGRGILDNSHYKKEEARPIEINQSKNVMIDGIILTEAKHWCCASFASNNVTYSNFKIVSDNDVDDGIDIVGSTNVLVDNCFIKTKDDCIAVKSGINYFTKFNSGFKVDNIVIQNSTMWNGLWGNALEIGFETRTDTIQNVTFKNLDIIHVEGPEGTFTIHNGDRALIKNIRYEDIRIEDSKGWLIDFRVLQSRYSKDKKRGQIDGVLFKNIEVEGNHYPASQIIGFNDYHTIKNVTLENFFIHGIRITSIYNGMIATAHLDNLLFK
jgi:hypothetical protein